MILRFFIRFISDVYCTIRGWIWKAGLSRSHRLQVLPGKHFTFIHYGDITRLLFEQQHLVSIGRSFETDVLKIFVGLIKPGSVILDIGANVGLYSLLGSEMVGPAGRILAFEPEPATHAALLKNLNINGIDNVTALPMALSDRNGMVELSVPEEVKARYEFGDSYLSMNPAADEGSRNAIPCRRLDEVLEEMNLTKVDLIKIDVEGAEYLCLSGADRLLQGDHKPIILMECDEILSRRFGHSVFDTLFLLHQHGYQSEQIGLHQWIARPRS